LLHLIAHNDTKIGKTPLNKGSLHRRNFYLTTHNTHTRLTSMTRACFEPAIPASERPHSHYSDGAVTGISNSYFHTIKYDLLMGLFSIHTPRINNSEYMSDFGF
jgi:hypothetical protein